MLQRGSVNYPIIAPSVLVGTLQPESTMTVLLDRPRFEPIDKLPWGGSRLYLSKAGLSAADRKTLHDALEHASKSGDVWRTSQVLYPAHVLTGSLRAR